jgi:CheY-like chemotaxis protein
MKYIPDFFSLVNGKVILSSGKYKYQFPEEIQKSIIGFINYPAIPFFLIADDTSWLALSLVPPQKNTNNNDLSFINKEYINKMIFDLSVIPFETEKTKIWRFFNFGPLMCKTFEIDLPPKTFSISKPWKHTNLNENEKSVFLSLLEIPELSDYKRSKFLKISHPTITKIRKELIKNGFIKKILIPNYSKLGFSILSWFLIRIDSRETDGKTLFPLTTFSNNILSIQCNTHIFLLAFFKNMKSLMEGQQIINNFITTNSISYEDINFNYYSLDSSNLNFTFNILTPIQISLDLTTQNKDILTIKDPEEQLGQLLRPYLSDFEIESVIEKIKKSLSIHPSTYRVRNDNASYLISMILELLTEQENLSVLEEYKKNTLQIELIDKLNYLKSKLELKDQTGTLIPKKSVMIVEDQKAVAMLLEDMLDSADYNVLGVVDNGLEAYNLYKKLSETENKPDIILMDVFLKGVNGIEATKMIKTFDPLAKIVILTSSPSKKLKSEVSSYGIDDYLIKPVTKAHLINRLDFVSSKNNPL